MRNQNAASRLYARKTLVMKNDTDTITNPSIQFEISELKHNWRSWNWWKDIYSRRVYSHFLQSNGIYVFDEPWDNLILFDACRFDTFREMNQIQGQLEYRISRGSASEEFLIENFAKHPTYKVFPDLVYVAANPYVSSLVPDRFHQIYPVWDYGWDDDLRTVPPENVVKDALRAKRNHPDKRLIIHFMQPHFPPLVGKLQGDIGFEGLRRAVLDNANPYNAKPLHNGILAHDVTVEKLLDSGKLSADKVWAAYKQNLRIVLSYAEKLIPDLSGKTVITSDHGELIGERIGFLFPFKLSGHRRNFHVKQLVKVPWLIVSDRNPSQRAATNEMATKADTSEADDEKIKDRLRKLGYI